MRISTIIVAFMTCAPKTIMIYIYKIRNTTTELERKKNIVANSMCSIWFNGIHVLLKTRVCSLYLAILFFQYVVFLAMTRSKCTNINDTGAINQVTLILQELQLLNLFLDAFFACNLPWLTKLSIWQTKLLTIFMMRYF